MKSKTKFFNRFILLLLTTFVLSCSSDDDNGPDQMEADPGMVDELNIVEAAQATSSISSLVAALAKADESASNDLIATLSDEAGTFTVLAPTNDAFRHIFNESVSIA